MENTNKIYQKDYITIFFLSILILLFKWTYSFSFFNEDITLRIINDTGDNAYYPLIKSFSEFIFNPGFSVHYDDLKIVSFPILSLIINALFYKVFGDYSFIILEFISVFLFILIFFYILIEVQIDKVKAIFFSLFLLLINKFLILFSSFDLYFIEILRLNFESFYSLRFPRPIITNLFLYAFIYFLIKFYKSKNNSFNYIIILSILMGISLNSFFYHAINEFFALLIVLLYKFKLNLFKEIINNNKKVIYSVIIGTFFISIFIAQISFSENDYVERLGIFEVNNLQKSVLSNYLFNLIIKKEFLILFILNSSIFLFVKNRATSVFYFVYISSIISSFFIFNISTKGIDYYHFINFIIIHGVLNLIMFLIYFISKIKFSKINQKISTYIYSISIFVIIIFTNFTDVSNYKYQYNEIKTEREKQQELVNFIKNTELFKDKEIEIFNMNYKLSIWLILNDYKNFSILPVSFWTSKNNKILENELNSTSNFFNININEFNELISNKKKTWRFKNDFVYNFFGRQYLANNLTHADKDLNQYTNEEIELINKNNLLISHQVVIPKNELIRLENNFLNSKDKITPKIIILNKNSVYPFSNIPATFCSIFDNQNYEIYSLKSYKVCK